MSQYLGYQQTGFANSSVNVTRAAGTETSIINHDSDPVSLYLPFDSDVQDTSANNHTVTAGGSAAVSSTQAKFGGKSLSLSGTDDYLQIADNAAFEFGSGDWTLETWFYQNDNTGHIIAQKRNTNGTWGAGAWTLGVNTNYGVGNEIVGRIEFFSNEFNSSSPLLEYEKGSAFSSGWHHLALTRAGSDWKLFLDGFVVATGSWGGTMSDASYPLTIGRDTYAGSGQRGYLNGYLDDFRIIKGVARYIKSFVPPSAAVGATLDGTIETNTTTDFTSLYLPFDSDINDDSSHGHSVTASGSAAISSTQTKFGSNSLFIDASGDYLSIPSDSSFRFEEGDFTIEMFIRPDDISTTDQVSNLACIIDHDADASTTGGWFALHQQNQALVLGANNGTLITTSNCLSATTWHHVAVVRAGGTTTIYCDGVNVGSSSDTHDYDDSTSRNLYIGKQNITFGGGNAGGTRRFDGYIDDLRILKGYAKYTANFVPPSSAVGTSVSETVNDLTVLYMPFNATEVNTSVSSNQTTLYLPFDSDIQDDSAKAHSMTATGDAAISSAQSKFGGYSLATDGTGDRLEFTYDTDSYFGTGDFTVEAWVWITGYSGGYYTIVSLGQPGATGSYQPKFLLNVESSGGKVRSIVGGTYIDHSSAISGSFPTGEWVHLAATRHNGTYKTFINGVLNGSTSDSTDVTSDSGTSTIGGANYGSGSGTAYSNNGYIDDLRIIKGTALYTENFTVPTSALGTTGSTISVSGGFEDQARNHSVTKSGTAQMNVSVKKFGTSSLLLDGDSDFLTIPNNRDFQFGNGDFTIEMQIYMLSNAGSGASDRHGLIARRDDGSNRSFHIGIQLDGGQQKLQFSHSTTGGGGTQTNYNTDIQLNTWTHIAIVRSGSSVFAFVDGVKNGTSHSIGSDTIFAGTSDLTIGHRVESTQYFHGYMDDIRIIKGLAKYTDNFTAPTSELGHGSITSSTESQVSYQDTKFLSGVWNLREQQTKMNDEEWISNDSRIPNGAGLQDENHRWYSVPPTPPNIGSVEILAVGAGGHGGNRNTSGSNTVFTSSSTGRYILAVGGGGAGPAGGGVGRAGGGGGGFVSATNLTLDTDVSYTLTVGASGGTPQGPIGPSSYPSWPGGSGGGGTYVGGGQRRPGGTGVQPSTPQPLISGIPGASNIQNLGYDGTSHPPNSDDPGSDNGPGRGGGGLGTSSSITGTATTYAGGGYSGNRNNPSPYLSNPGPGGSASQGSGSGGNGTRGGGGGGAGASSNLGGLGGPGVFVIAYPDSENALSITGSLSYSQPSRSGYRVYYFTSGTGTITLPS